MILAFENFYCDASKNEKYKTKIVINSTEVSNISKLNLFTYRFEINLIILDFTDQYTSFEFSDLNITIKNLFLTMDHRLNSNEKYCYDPSNLNIDYDYLKSGLIATLKYRNNNFTIEKLITMAYESTNLHNFKLEFSENNYSSVINVLNLTGNITMGIYWNTLHSL